MSRTANGAAETMSQNGDVPDYSTQFLLLVAQLVHESAVHPLTVVNAKPILQKLKTHPIVTREDGQLKMTESQFVKLYHHLLEANELSTETETEHDEKDTHHKAPEYATQLCEILYDERCEEIKRSLGWTQETFRSQLSVIEQQ